MTFQQENFQIHRYKSGHQLVSSTVTLQRPDQDVIDRLSDISGQLRPNERFTPYFTCYPLPSQEFFVIARTWQDIGAPRAGCVFTKSLLVPMAKWEEENNVKKYFQDLIEYVPELLTTTIENRDFIDLHSQIHESYIDELTEALFLEERTSIVVFNASQPDQVMYRLYASFWPGMKKVFSVCTFSLSPRTISNKFFDLQFSPSVSKTKFADWAGRKIDAMSQVQLAPRHRWTQELKTKIFIDSDIPLAESTNFNLLNIDRNSDEGTLRLSLLWNELLSKSQSTPTAILGLLDIVNSQEKFKGQLFSDLEPVIYSSLYNVQMQMSPASAWQFYVALIGKFSKKHMSLHMLKAIKKATENLAYSEPEATIQFLDKYSNSNQEISPVLFASIGNGISNHIIREDISTQVLDVLPKYSSRLISASKKFSVALMHYWPLFHSALSGETDLLADGDEKARSTAKVNLSSLVHSPRHFSLLPILFADADTKVVKRIIHGLANSTKFQFYEINQKIVEEAAKHDCIDYLFAQTEANWNEMSNEQILTDIFRISPLLINNVFEGSLLTFEQKFAVFSSVFAEISSSLAEIIFEDDRIAAEVISVLEKNSAEAIVSIVNILGYSNIPIEDSLSKISKYSSENLPPRAPGLYNLILKSLSAAPASYNDMVGILISKINLQDFDWIFTNATKSEYSKDRIVNNLELLFRYGNNLRTGLTNSIDTVSYLLNTNIQGTISTEISYIWSDLMVRASSNKEKQGKAAAQMLDFAYRNRNQDVLNLLLVAFPIVYETYKDGSSISWFLPFMLFNDWDKCRTLREDLVNKYINSNWPPMGLFIVAYRAGITRDVFKILDSYRGTKNFVDAARAELKELSNPESRAILKEFKR